jgi:poly(A) polymerase
MIPERLRPLLAADSPLQDLAARFAGAGKELYLVGGSVRDAFLGLLVEGEQDLDLTTNAHPADIERLVSGWADHLWLQGKAFGTVGAAKDGFDFEITTFRAEVYRPDSRKPVVTYSDNLETDLSRRDFTINAMALSLPEPRLIDPHNGVADLAARCLRTPLDPELSFADDPLRMMRAARFISQLGVEPDPALASAVRELRGRLEIVSVERVTEELRRILRLPDPTAALWFLVDTGLAEEFLPELPGLALEQDPIHHHKDVLAHTIAVVAKTKPDLKVRLAALFHDVGKPKTRSFGPDGVSFHLHDVVGARMTEERMRALKFSNDEIEDVSALVALHLRFHTYKMGWTDKAVRRYVRDAGHLLGELNELVRCDCTTRNATKARALSRRMDDLERRIEELRSQEEIDAVRPPLDGHRVMQLLGVGPSRIVGEALNWLLEARLDEGPMSEEEAERRLLAWAAERQG